MVREGYEGARSGTMKSPEKTKSNQGSEKKIKAIAELREENTSTNPSYVEGK